MNPNTFAAYRRAVSLNCVREANCLLGELLIEAQPLAERLARRLERGDYHDLLQVGRMALVQAIQSYDPERGAFVAFAKLRINTAMDREVISRRPMVVDSSVRWSPMPKSVRRAAEAFIARTGRQATAEELGVSEEDLTAWRSPAHFEAYEEGSHVSRSIPGEGRDLTKAVSVLEGREHRVFMLRIVEGLEFRVIGQREGFSPDTAEQVYANAVERLRSFLRG